MKRQTIMLGAGVLAGMAGVRALRNRKYQLDGKVAFVTGGSRGLGLLVARELAGRGCRVAICARDSEELERGAAQLRSLTPDLLTIPADITIREEAELAVAKVRERFGSMDILVNNAGTIAVGPMEVMTIDDYRDSLNTHFWGPYFTTMAALPDMRRRGHGRVVNISSIGGKISVPHLLPYSVGKFALTAFSEGLRAELRKDNILVTTVCPGLMRTGSPRNASFKGKNEAEYAWFSISDSLPLFSIGATRAARSIVNACERGKAEVILSLPAKLATPFHGVFPGITADLLSIVNRLLPSPGGIGSDVRTGKQSESRVSPSWLTALNEMAARQNNQVA
jgi:NAD(P)-dependent dehydrogenase (short-subunit alcohol dehydrogenase family)